MNCEGRHAEKDGNVDAVTGRGVAIRLMGAVLLFLGGLNSLLALKSNSTPDGYSFFLLASGAVLFAAGLIRSRGTEGTAASALCNTKPR